MKLVYKGKFDGNAESLPHGEHMPGAVKFKEAEDPKKLSNIANGISLVILAAAVAGLIWRGGFAAYSFWGILVSLLTLFPHEILHAVCFRKTVYLYTWMSKGMAFVIGPETMTKRRFVFMSLLPNLVFGLLPYVLFMINPDWGFLGSMGAFCLSMGAGDYYNVFNAMTQMPKGARTYLYQFNSYWYMPGCEEK